MLGKHPQFQTFKLKQRLLQENVLENKCMMCGITEWMNKKIHMELHHKNGVRHDHRINNLLLLCPNCHSQTETFRAKNMKNGR